MKITRHNSVSLVLVLCLILSACRVKGPDSVQWSNQQETKEFQQVIINNENLTPVDSGHSFEVTTLGDPSSSPFEFKEWCRTSSGYKEAVLCAGNEENGWWEIKGPNGEVTEIQVRSNKNPYTIRVIEGVYYLFCKDGTNQKIDKDVVENIKKRTSELDKTYETLSKAKSDLYASIVGVVGSVVAGCLAGAIAGAVIGGSAFVGVGAIPGAILGCKAVAIAGGVITVVRSLGEKLSTGLFNMVNANRDINKVKTELSRIVNAYCQ